MVLDAARDYFKKRPTKPTSKRVSAGTPAQPSEGTACTSTRLEAVAFFKDNRRVAVLYDDRLKIWDVQKRAFVGAKGWPTDLMDLIAISPDDRRVSYTGFGHTVIIWDVESKQMLFSPPVKHTGWVRSLCFSLDGKTLASGSDDTTIIIWDTETGTVLATLEGHDEGVTSVAFSPDGQRLASASSDITMRIWCLDSAQLLLKIVLPPHSYTPTHLQWLPGGQQLVSTDYDKVEFRDSSTGLLVGQPCTGHTQRICSLVVSSDGSFIATGSGDKTVRFWNVKTHKQIGQALEHDNGVSCLTMSANDELLATVLMRENKLCMWSVKNLAIQELFGEKEKQKKEELQQLIRDHVSIYLYLPSGI